MPSDSYRQTIIDHLRSLSGLVAIYLHGSVAKGTARPNSDLDLAVLYHHECKANPVQLLELAGELEARLGQPVHLGILSLDHLVFAKEVIAYGKTIFCNDKKYCDEFAMRVLSAYAELNERRNEVLKAYRKQR